MVTVNRSNDTIKMSQTEIEEYAKRFLKEAYDLELTIPIVINGRLTSTLGSFNSIHTKTKNVAKCLEFSKKYLTHGNKEDIIGTIKHECIHFALFMLGKPYKDGHPIFESELKKHNSHSTETVELLIERNVRVYSCKCKEYIYLTTITPKQCTVCSQRLAYVGRRKQLV